MKILLPKIIFFSLLLVFAVLCAIIFLPRSYNVPELKKRDNIKFWKLQSGSEIAYTLVEGKSKRKPYPIIFLQGGPGGPIYNRNIETLKPLAEDGYNVYLYDQVGCGFSNRLDNIEEYTAERHKQDLEEILSLINSEKVIIIGQSWGAILAVLFIADNQRKVDKIIFTSPGPVFPLNKKLAEMAAPDSLKLKSPVYSNRQANQKVNDIRMNLASFLAKNFGIKLVSDEETDDFQTYLNSFLNKSTVCDTAKAPKAEAGGGFYAQLMTVNSFKEIINPRPKLQNITIPILVVKGQCDNQKWGYTNEYLNIFPNHKLLVIPDAGHSISIEQPEIYIEDIRSFLYGQ